jgi:hypothetical protein
MTEYSAKDDITLFDIKYKDAMERLNSLILSEDANNSFAIKNFINIYRLELSQEKINSKSKSKSKNNIKKKKILKANEIPLKDKISKQYYNNKYLNKEIVWYKIKQKEKRKRNLVRSNDISQKIENDLLKKEISKELDRNNNFFHMNHFSKSPNQLFNENKLIRKIHLLKNDNNYNKDYSTLNSNIINNQYIINNEMHLLSSNKNKQRINNKLAKINIKVNKSEKIMPLKKLKLKSDIKNILSRNINHNIIRKKESNNEDEEKSTEKNISYKYLLNKYKIIDENIDYS